MTEHIKQNESGLYLDIQRIGCFFRTQLLHAELKTGKSLNIAQINRLWEKCLAFQYINPRTLDVERSAEIANLALQELGDRGRFVEVALFRDGNLTWYGAVPKQDRRCDFYTQKILQNGPSKTHFRPVDKYGNMIEDPHAPEIQCREVVYTICYRYDGEK